MKQRLWTTILMILWQVGGFSQVAPLQARYALSGAVVPYHQGSGFTEVSFEIAGGLIVVEARLEGRSGFFILDTGAPTLVVNRKRNGGSTEKALSAVGSFLVERVEVGRFEWGGIKKTALEAIALDLDHLEEACGRPLMGLIGYQIFADREILIDSRRMKILFFKGTDNDLARLATPLRTMPFVLLGHLPVITAQIGEQSFQFGFDSGSTGNLLDQAGFNRIPETEVAFVHYREVRCVNKEIRKIPVFRTPSFSLRGGAFAELEFMVLDLSHLQDSTVSIHGLLGYPQFRNLLFSINYPHRQLNIWGLHYAEASP